jgi:hypothetical protein
MTYIVIDAPGYYGTYAEIYSTHASLSEAIADASRHSGRIVSDDGGDPESHYPGAMIHRRFAAAYRVHWSPRLAAKKRNDARQQTALAEADERFAGLYGRGSTQYCAALADWKIRHRE